MSKKRIWLVPLMVVALVAISGVAAADDTTINSGYDEENQTLILNSYSEGDDCELVTEGELSYTITEDGLVEIEGVTSGDTTCDVQAMDVTGPVGQVNHGTFVSAIATLYEGASRGCVIRHFAQSDLGMGDQQINAPDVEESDGEDSLAGTAEFTSVVSECEANGNGEDVSAQGKPEWAGQGPPPWAGQGRPESPGNSAAAPGRAGR